MKFSKYVILPLLVLLLSLKSYAHGGEDHDAPIKQKAPKGGIIKSLENTFIEVVSRGQDIKIYLYDKSLKPKSVNGFTVSALAEMPRTKKQEQLSLKANENFYEIFYDAKNLHRYTLLLSIKDPSTGHDDKLKFTIEPKK
jgi:hypothetical protein